MCCENFTVGDRVLKIGKTFTGNTFGLERGEIGIVMWVGVKHLMVANSDYRWRRIKIKKSKVTKNFGGV